MLDATMVMLVLVILAALAFDYVNGFHDTANAIATSVSTRALSVKSAICIAAVLNFAGAMVSTKVAATIGKGIVDPTTITQMIVLLPLQWLQDRWWRRSSELDWVVVVWRW